jgi:multidrug resistance efflux pump
VLVKINLLYLIVPLALGACYYIVTDIRGQSGDTFFGTAETEPKLIHIDQDVEVQRLFVKSGVSIKAGDTLAILVRRQLAETDLALAADLQKETISLQGSNAILSAELGTNEAEKAAKIAEYEAKITQIQVRDSVESALRKALFGGAPAPNKEAQQEIEALKLAIVQTGQMYALERDRISAEARANSANAGTRTQYTKSKQSQTAKDRERLVLLAPVSGYVDQLTVLEGDYVRSYTDMMRIFPIKTQKVIGFIHENADLPFQIGQKVNLVSATRATIIATGQITAASPKLVELPLRLRKFVEVRAWGREVMIQIQTENDYYIGEKVNITLQPMPQ